MLTVRPLDEQGNWQYKAEKEYLCVRNGEERGFTAAEFKAAQADGWEKQYHPPVEIDWEHTGFFSYTRSDFDTDTREEMLSILAKHFGLEEGK